MKNRTVAILMTLLFAVVALLYAQSSAPAATVTKPIVYFTSYNSLGYNPIADTPEVGSNAVRCYNVYCPIMSLSGLPPGSYLITANIDVTSPGAALVFCSLSDSKGVLNLPASAVGASLAGGSFLTLAAPITLQATVKYSGTTTVTLSCEDSASSNVYVGIGPGTLSSMPVIIK